MRGIQTLPLQAGGILEIELPVSPAFAGSFSTVPLQVRADHGRAVALPPLRWEVAPGSGS